ncbi:hypothetical protein F9K97_24815 [Brucella anthropi]|jgi:hypothetical protein|uniref:hypothetical protein n=1 Tax=Brucella anthropi TaxID=529 RepID=UPI00124D22BB|nr:hypothetical protein [Brucella anthropi]KAB2774649.1 hypothetical protein F9K97_24815 [Brucella anthropi]
MEYERWAEVKSKRDLMEEQTAQIADLLESVGISARLESDVVAISAVTGLITSVSPWRPIRFLPSVAARDRRPMLNALGYWLNPKNNREADYMRYAVVTSGQPVPAFGELRETLKLLARRISKWAHIVNRKWGIEVNFRGTEFTRKTAAERGLEGYDPDTVLYHPHANILLRPKRFLKEDQWKAFLSWSHEYFGAEWKDCGVIVDPREIVKYVVKPSELLEGDKPIDALEAKWLHETLFRINLSQPLGKFKKFWGHLNENRCKVVSVFNDYGESKLTIIGRGKRFDHSKKDEVEPDPDQVETEQPKGRGTNILIGVTLPQWKHSPWSEPVLLVQNYDPRAVGRATSERLAEIDTERMLARQLWDEAGAPDPAIALEIAKQWASKSGSNVSAFRRVKPASYKVHTSRLSVRNEVKDISPTFSSSPPQMRDQEAPPNGLVIDPDFKIDDFKLPDFGSRRKTA